MTKIHNSPDRLNSQDEQSHLELLATVAFWYYEEDVDQNVIAERIGRSRSMVSRLLREARDMGLVEFRVKWPLSRDSVSEQALCTAFNLSHAWVLGSSASNHTTILHGLGALGAQCMQQHLRDGVRVGIGWGRGVHHVVNSLPFLPLQEGLVVQIIGSAGQGDPRVEGAELARWLAEKIGARYRFLSAPLIVENESVAEGLLKERMIRDTLRMGSEVDVALVGIGALDPTLSGLYRTGYLMEDDISALKEAGAVGDLLARQLDNDGNELNVTVNRCVIGLEIQQLKRIKNVVAVACGEAKADAIRAALLGGYITELVTDSSTAKLMLMR